MLGRWPGGAGAGAVSWLCMWCTQVAGAGAWWRWRGRWWRELAVRVVETGCWCWVPYAGAGAGAGAVGWLRTWWRQGASVGAGAALAAHVVETGCWAARAGASSGAARVCWK